MSPTPIAPRACRPPGGRDSRRAGVLDTGGSVFLRKYPVPRGPSWHRPLPRTGRGLRAPSTRARSSGRRPLLPSVNAACAAIRPKAGLDGVSPSHRASRVPSSTPAHPHTHTPTHPHTRKPTNPQTHKPTNPQTHTKCPALLWCGSVFFGGFCATLGFEFYS